MGACVGSGSCARGRARAAQRQRLARHGPSRCTSCQQAGFQLSFGKYTRATPCAGSHASLPCAASALVILSTRRPAPPLAGSQVTVTYTARVLPDGPVFDQKSEEEPLQFTTDEGGSSLTGVPRLVKHVPSNRLQRQSLAACMQ